MIIFKLIEGLVIVPVGFYLVDVADVHCREVDVFLQRRIGCLDAVKITKVGLEAFEDTSSVLPSSYAPLIFLVFGSVQPCSRTRALLFGSTYIATMPNI